jgi:transcriptional regulator with XRE-family HTH domain
MKKTLKGILAMDFPQRLTFLRKQKKLTQQALSDLIGIHVTQMRRYEAGTSQPTLEILRKLAIALSVSADMLLFDRNERGPDEDLRLHFEAAARLDPEEKKMLKSLLEGMLLKHDSKNPLTTR